MDRPAKLAFVDTETTGLSHLSRPWEIAVILRETDHVEVPEMAVPGTRYIHGETRDTEYVRHVRYGLLSLPEGTEPGALEVSRWHERGHGIRSAAYLDDLDNDGANTGAGSEAAIAHWLHRLLGGATLVGIGVHYDAEVLGRMFLRHGLPWHPWDYDIRDLKTITRGYILGRYADEATLDAGIDPHTARSEDLAAWLGVKPPTDEERHTAPGDARWAVRWWDAL